MILPLIAYALVVGLALAAMSATLECALALRRRPRRWIWAAALGVNLLLTMAVPWRGHGPSPAASTTAWIASTTGRMIGAGAYRSDASARPHWLNRIRLDVNEAERAAVRLDPLVGRAWALGSFAVTVIYAGSLWTLSRRRRYWRDTQFRGIRILVASHDGPAVVGVWKPRIVVPSWTLALEPPAVDLMLAHEREHQRARDPLLLQAGSIAVLAMPWNPAAWWMASRLKLAIEMDCDARVLEREAPAGDAGAYGELLLTVATRQSPARALAAPAMLEHPSTLRRRIAAMYPNRPALSGPRLATACGTAFVLLIIAVLVPAPALRAQPPKLSGAAPPPLAQSGAPAKSPAPPATPAQVYEIGNGVSSPVPIRQQDPTYTEAAKQAKIQGEVLLAGIVETNGLLDHIRVTRSLDTVHGLDQAAIDAAKKWMFKPAMKDGQPVPVHVQLILEFRLTTSTPPTTTGDEEFGKGAYTEATTDLVLPSPKRRIDPTYTREAMNEKLQGTVTVEIVVAPDGTVDRARVVQSTDQTHALDASALVAAKKWIFEPGTLNGQPVPVLVTLTMEFRLH